MQTDFIEKIQATIANCNSKGLYKGNYIPENKLSNAIKHFPFDTKDIPFALIDTTVFGSAKQGMIIGANGIYFKNDWSVETVRNFLSWQEMAEYNFKIKKKSFDIEIMPNCNFGMSGCGVDKDVLINLLTEIISWYKNTHNSSDIIKEHHSNTSQPSYQSTSLNQKSNQNSSLNLSEKQGSMVNQKDSFQLSEAKKLSKLSHKKAIHLLKEEIKFDDDGLSWLFFGLLENHIELILNDEILNDIGSSDRYIKFVKPNLKIRKNNSNQTDIHYIYYLLATKIILVAIYCYCTTRLPNEFKDEIGKDTMNNIIGMIYPYLEKFKDVLEITFKNYNDNYEDDEDATTVMIGLFSGADIYDKKLTVSRKEAVETLLENLGLKNQTTRAILVNSERIIDKWMIHGLEL